MSNLNELGKKIIRKYIEDNQKREKILIRNSDYLYQYNHQGKPITYNLWKNSTHTLDEFSKVPIDKVHIFKKEPLCNPAYLTKPFRRPKENGDYFDKNIFN